MKQNKSIEHKTDWFFKIGKKNWKFFFIISNIGIEFNHNGDWVYWMWWWKRDKRYPKGKFFSVNLAGYFDSLIELDKEWKKYWENIKKTEKKENKDEDDDRYGVDIVV